MKKPLLSLSFSLFPPPHPRNNHKFWPGSISHVDVCRFSTGVPWNRRWPDTYRISPLLSPPREKRIDARGCALRSNSERIPLFCRVRRDRCCHAREPCYCVYRGVRRKREIEIERERESGSGKRRSAEKDKRNSTYLAYFSAYVLPELVETSRQGHLVTASHSILARQFVHRVPDVIALEQISNSIIPTLFLSLFFFFTLS